MIKSYLKIAWRKLRKNKLYTFVNITGLTAGIVSCLLIGIYVMHEFSYDRFNINAGRIARVTMEYSEDGHPQKIAVTGTKVGPQFMRTFPQIESYVRLEKLSNTVAYGNRVFRENRLLYADSSLFSIFSFPLVSGSPANALNGPDKVVVTESTARKYFNTTNAIGKTLKIGGKDFFVSAVAADSPADSQIQFDFILSFANLSAAKKPEQWYSANYITYILLKKGSSLQSLQKQVAAYMKTVSRDELKYLSGQYLTYHLQPLTSVHLHSSLPDGLEPNGNITYIYILLVVALLILIIAGVNYVNLSIAQASARGGEIGIRKVMGAARAQLFKQFIGEALLITFISVLIAFLFAALLLPFFNELSGKDFNYAVLLQPLSLAFLLSLGLLIGFVAGAYPAFLLSNIKLVKILKSGFSFTSGKSVRRSLIVFQFVISIFLIVTTIVVLQQLSYIRNKDIGYNKSNVVVIPVGYKMLNQIDGLKKAIRAIPGVADVAAANSEPVNVQWGDAIETDGGQRLSVNALPMDEDFIKTMQIKIIAGRDFDHTDVMQIDTTNQYKNFRYAFMLNESGARALGWSPQQAIGKQISKNFPGTVLAVVKDFNFKSFHDPIGPLLIFLDHDFTQDLFVRINSISTERTLNQIAAVWKTRVQDRPFEYNFLDDDYNALYHNEQRTAGLFTTFSVLAILLACLGLFAITAFTVMQRTREIGIRKVLGAGIVNIILLISKDFLKLVLVAMVVAAPIALFASRKWLDDFAYRIHIQWWIFIAVGIGSLVIAAFTISVQALKAAMANPVDSLRNE